jgi:phage tail protein X
LLSEETTLTGPRKAKTTKSGTPGASRKILFTAVVSALVSAAVTLGFSLSTQAPNLSGALKDVKEQLEVSNAQIEYLQQQLGFQQGILTLNYTARQGDTLESIAQQFYGSPDGVQILLDSNPSIKENEVPTGTSLVITSPNGIDLAQIEPNPKEQEKK